MSSGSLECVTSTSCSACWVPKICLSSSFLSANRYKSVVFPAFMGLMWDLEPVLHRWGRQGLAEKFLCVSFVLQKGEARSALARVVANSFKEDRNGTMKDGWFAQIGKKNAVASRINAQHAENGVACL